jgi:hypothetical protein
MIHWLYDPLGFIGNRSGPSPVEPLSFIHPLPASSSDRGTNRRQPVATLCYRARFRR